MSRKTRSGFSRWMAAIAARPSAHSATISRSGSSCNNVRRRPRARASSSLSKTRMDMIGRDLLSHGSIGNADLHGASAAGGVFQHHGMVFVVELLQASASIAQSDAFGRHETAAGKSDAIVADLHPNVVAVAPGTDTNHSAGAARADTVADGVLDNRLENQVGNESIQSARIDFRFHMQPVVKTHLLDVDVLLKERKLLLQRYLVNANAVQRHT